MSEITQFIEDLLPMAREASQKAYSPYSKVRVGAVLVGKDGKKYSGCNVENASYGLTQCAERNALGAAIVAGDAPRSSKVLLVYATGFKTLTPCGACRQVMSELLAKDATIISCSDDEPARIWKMDELLPDPFTLE
jgi:cytidine deaminase